MFNDYIYMQGNHTKDINEMHHSSWQLPVHGGEGVEWEGIVNFLDNC